MAAMLGAQAAEGAAVALLRLLLLLLLSALRGPGFGVVGTAGAGLSDSVIWAVNAGGEAHVDVHGIHFRKDPLEGRVGRASDYGMKLPILRSNPEDQILYQTERYNEETFGYEVPIKEEGDYVLVLKFAEVYFAQSQQKVFDVRLNGHVVVKDLDIFDRVGHSTAHDEIIPMSIRKGKLSVLGEVSTFTGKLYIEFVKGYYDNPKVCALYIMAGTVDDVPKLQPHPGLEKKERRDNHGTSQGSEEPETGCWGAGWRFGNGQRQGRRISENVQCLTIMMAEDHVGRVCRRKWLVAWPRLQRRWRE